MNTVTCEYGGEVVTFDDTRRSLRYVTRDCDARESRANLIIGADKRPGLVFHNLDFQRC